MPEDSDSQKVRMSFSIQGSMPLSNRFMRDRPAAEEGPEQAWELAQQVVDHGAYLLDAINSVGAGRQIRDLVLAALLRRSLVIAEGVRQCLYHSLEEPAVVLLRALLEVELNMRLVTADETDRMARRLAAYHHLKAKRHVTEVLSDPEARGEDAEFQDFMKGAGRRQKEFFQSEAFDDVREELAAAQHWHGYANIREAFEAVDGGTDYLHLYDSFSPFVHSANLDFDFVDIVDGKPHMKPLPQRDPTPVQHYLQGCVLILIRIMRLFVEDKGAQDYDRGFTVKFETGEEHDISPLDALQQYAIAIWGSAEGWEVVNGETDGMVFG